MLRKTYSFVFAFLFLISHAYSQVNPLSLKDLSRNTGREYYAGIGDGKPLITVNIISGVNLPGTYHVPIDTDISELLSYAGGTLPHADLSKVFLRNSVSSKGIESKTYNVSKIMESTEPFPILQDKDLVHIESRTSLDSTLKWLTIFSLIATTVSAVVIIDNQD